MRRLLLKVLVITVFLNAVVGLPLHAAIHVGVGDTVQAHAVSISEASSSDHGDEQGDGAHAPCAWCLAQAESSGAPPAAFDAERLGDWRRPPAPPKTVAPPVFSAGLWSSAPRGPPSA
jgi:hypothetical protein